MVNDIVNRFDKNGLSKMEGDMPLTSRHQVPYRSGSPEL